MSMMMFFKHVTQKTMESLKARPDLVEIFFLCEPSEEPATDPSVRVFAANDKFMEMKTARPGMVRALYGRNKNSPQAQALEKEFLGCVEEWGPPGYSLEKDWLKLHQLLSGSNEPTKEPLGQAILGGLEIGSDIGYGPAHYMESGNVRRVADALMKISEADFKKRAGKGIEDIDYFWKLMKGLAGYYKEAVDLGHAMFLYMR
jgi:Domain of unknown function (DUF1877)